MNKILKLNQVKELTGLCRSNLYKFISEGRFPKQINLSERSVGWSETEVNQWITDRIKERDDAHKTI